MAEARNYDLRGFRPFDWDCDRDGCFNRKKRLKFAHFYDCLPGKISFTDLDGLVEVSGRFLFLEFKQDSQLNDLKDGQRICFEELTKALPGSLVVVMSGDAETMTITHIRVCRNGRFGLWEPCTMEELRAKIRHWGRTASEEGRKRHGK